MLHVVLFNGIIYATCGRTRERETAADLPRMTRIRMLLPVCADICMVNHPAPNDPCAHYMPVPMTTFGITCCREEGWSYRPLVAGQFSAPGGCALLAKKCVNAGPHMTAPQRGHFIAFLR
jgi:hypothetical protein